MPPAPAADLLPLGDVRDEVDSSEWRGHHGASRVLYMVIAGCKLGNELAQLGALRADLAGR